MGTWNTKINGNDAFMDIYQNFFERYNQGESPTVISSQIQEDFAEDFADYEDGNNSLFGLALAQWETKSLSVEIFNRVKEVIESGKDLEIWTELGADEKTIKQRRIVLENFTKQISTERKRPKRQVKPNSEYEKITLVNIIAPDLKKTFTVSEEYNNNQYIHTSAHIKWEHSTRPVLFFKGQGKKISAEWCGSQALKINYPKDLNISKWDDPVCSGDEDITVIYNEI